MEGKVNRSDRYEFLLAVGEFRKWKMPVRHVFWRREKSVSNLKGCEYEIRQLFNLRYLGKEVSQT